MTIGQRIKQIRTSAALSQEDFGDRLGVTRQTISKWELDQALPELAKVVLISRVFSVTTDSILVEGIDGLIDAPNDFLCGVYKSDSLELIETERLALVFRADSDSLTAECYVGFGDRKHLRAICVYSRSGNRTRSLFFTDSGDQIGDVSLRGRLDKPFDTSLRRSLTRTETFLIDRSSSPLPTVDDAGIKNCLASWRMNSTLSVSREQFTVLLCTGVTEYVFDIKPRLESIYCGASFTIPTELGLLGGRQFFRIRTEGDSSAAYCKSHANLGTRIESISVPTSECRSGACVNTSQGLFWGIKRYSNDEIVLVGCGDDEYIYRRNSSALERFTKA